jgi:ribosome-associated protein
MLEIAPGISVGQDALEFHFVRSSGPGGQNVNKVSSAVQLRFNVAGATGLPEPVKRRLMRLAGTRLTSTGVLVIDARRHRSQKLNRRDALDRLRALVVRALRPPAQRRPTAPSGASRLRRLEAKRRRALIKRLRRPAGQ